jgi:hypothetical protein
MARWLVTPAAGARREESKIGRLRISTRLAGFQAGLESGRSEAVKMLRQPSGLYLPGTLLTKMSPVILSFERTILQAFPKST